MPKLSTELITTNLQTVKSELAEVKTPPIEITPMKIVETCQQLGVTKAAISPLRKPRRWRNAETDIEYI